MDFKDGSSALITIILMLVIVIILGVGITVITGTWDARNVTTTPEGITTEGDMINATNVTLHGLSAVAPNLVWIVVIFMFVIFFTLFAIALKRG